MWKTLTTPGLWPFYLISCINLTFTRFAIKREQKIIFLKNTARRKLGIFGTTMSNSDNSAVQILGEAILWLRRKICNHKFYTGRVTLLIVSFLLSAFWQQKLEALYWHRQAVTAVTGMLKNLDFSWDKLESGLQRLDSLRHIFFF